jgi:hypothetical protein
MKATTSLLLFLFGFIAAYPQSKIGDGAQAQVALDDSGAIRLVYGKADAIYYSISSDNGKSFSAPVLMGRVNEMHLGMTRGPQLASSRDLSVVTAMDKKGNIHAFNLTHKTGKWQKMENVNDVDGSAPEGLMSISADDANNFYAVWLDLREERKNNICFSSFGGGRGWSQNQFVYKSPDGHVCECCKPSIAVNGNSISIMFRNWLRGSRDLYLITSDNKGERFSQAQKLGFGTWPLKGCPMDGGGLSIDSRKNIHTAWQRDGIVFYAEPGKPEQKIGEGRGVGVSGRLVHWQKGPSLVFKPFNGDEKKVGEGRGLKMLQLEDESIIAIWEKDDQIIYKKM